MVWSVEDLLNFNRYFLAVPLTPVKVQRMRRNAKRVKQTFLKYKESLKFPMKVLLFCCGVVISKINPVCVCVQRLEV